MVRDDGDGTEGREAGVASRLRARSPWRGETKRTSRSRVNEDIVYPDQQHTPRRGEAVRGWRGGGMVVVLVAGAGGDGDGGGSDRQAGRRQAKQGRWQAGRQGGRARIDATGK